MSNITNLFDNWLNKSRSTSGLVKGAPQLPAASSTLVELSHLQEIVFKISSSGKWLYLSDKWFESTGYNPEECLGKSWLNHIHPQDHDACQGYIRRASKGQPDTLATSIRVISKQNELRWMEMRASILPDPAGKSFKLIGTLIDISEEKADNERQLANYRALSTLVSNIPGMVYRCRNNRDWTMEFVSAGCQELTGYNAEQVINNKAAWNDIIHPEAREYVWMTIQAAVQNQQPFELTYRITTREGEEKWVWEQGQGNFADNGELLGLEGLITDITDNKRQSLRIERDSLFDPVTNLSTQHLFFNRIQHAIELAEDQPDYTFSVVMLHISQHSNATNGLDANQSDLLAREIGKRLKAILKVSTSICRLRDDEFGILLEFSTNERADGVNQTIRSLLACLQAPLKLGQQVIYLKSSIGVASYAKHANNSEILQDANRAMAQARELGGGKIEFSDPNQNSRMATVLGTENELRGALEEGALELVCQPLTSISHSGPSSNAPALEFKLVWHHARRGTLPAERFYSHIEDPQLIRLLGKLILNSLPTQLAANLQADLPNSVYIHGLGEQLINGEAIDLFFEKIDTSAYPNSNFIVEIDAGQLAKTDKIALKHLQQLQHKRVSLAVSNLASWAPYTDLLTLSGVKAIKLNPGASEQDMAQYKATIAYYNALGIEIVTVS